MEIVGHISFKKIYYSNTFSDQQWYDHLPEVNWIAFIIADHDDAAIIKPVADNCFKKQASCICCAGTFAAEVEEYFSKELIRMNIPKEESLKKQGDQIHIPLLTVHTNFSEGFWFATNIANTDIGDPALEIDTVVCIDVTRHAVKKHIRDLIGKFNSGEMPSDHEFEEPAYDSEIA